MQMNPIGWIEIPVNDLDRAEKFYTDYFGFKLDRQEPEGGVTMSWFPMTMDSYGSACTLIKGDAYTPSSEGSLLYFTAPEKSVEKGVKKAEEMGLKIIQPKTSMGEHGFIAWIEDPEGNRIGIHSMDG